MARIPFNRPSIGSSELAYLQEVLEIAKLSGDGKFGRLCHSWLESRTGAHKALLTGSGTAALEMAALLLDIEEGDEVIMPSFTFPSTANAVVLRGATPVFIDIRNDTYNIDETLIEEAITNRTKAIFVVHYAGVSCEMNTINSIAERHGLKVVEDAAHAAGSSYRGESLGTLGVMGALSFHETKNFVCGEGGAILINDESYSSRAEIIREKGTNRNQFHRGEVDKYTWLDLGSSYLPSELQAAVLWAQLEKEEELQTHRSRVWNSYHERLERLEDEGLLRRPVVPDECEHNSHLYSITLRSEDERDRLMLFLKQNDVLAPFHYIPLHSSPAGIKFGRVSGRLSVTDSISSRLLRLPLFPGLSNADVERITDLVEKHLVLESKSSSGRPCAST